MSNFENIINNDLKRYNCWLLQKKLEINIDNISYLIFKQKNKKINEIQLQISDVGLTRTNKIKYLSLMLDDQLNWSAHIDHIKEKAISMTGALYRCRNFLTKNAKYYIYNAYFLSVFRYLIPVWVTYQIKSNLLM